MIVRDGYGYKCSKCGHPTNFKSECSWCGDTFSNYKELKEEEDNDELYRIAAIMDIINSAD